jgi:hypothetical protein
MNNTHKKNVPISIVQMGWATSYYNISNSPSHKVKLYNTYIPDSFIRIVTQVIDLSVEVRKNQKAHTCMHARLSLIDRHKMNIYNINK